MVDRIKALCKKRGISISELEEQSGIGKNTIYRWGKVMPRADKLARVAKVLGVTVECLLERDRKEVNKKE